MKKGQSKVFYEAYDALEWLRFLAVQANGKRTTVTVQTFETNVKYKYGRGPWKDSLYEAIECHL